jgi:hypothetical protein
MYGPAFIVWANLTPLSLQLPALKAAVDNLKGAGMYTALYDGGGRVLRAEECIVGSAVEVAHDIRGRTVILGCHRLPSLEINYA